MSRTEIQPNEWRVSMSGYSIKTGWSDEKRIIAQIPATTPKEFLPAWIDAAGEIATAHNAECAAAQQRVAVLEAAITTAMVEIDTTYHGVPDSEHCPICAAKAKLRAALASKEADAT